MKHRHLEIAKDTGPVRVGRREWLVGVLGSGVLVACGSSSSGATGSGGGSCAGFDAGPVSSFATGTWTKGLGFIVSQDAEGVYAYSTTCTHQGCEIGTPKADGIATCPCHGAQYDGNGAVLKGPAQFPLDHYAVTLCNGEVFVDTSTVVDASTRTPLG